MSAEWETEPVPEGLARTSAIFVWMAGPAAGKGAHSFDLSVGGELG
jgi:hypothetical protein